MTLQDRLDFARTTALEAGKLAQDLRRNPDRLDIAEKGHQDFVTAADLAVETLIRKRIKDKYGDEAVLGEETGLQGDSPHLWILDPIDGTTNFMHGLPDWAISIAYCHAGDIKMGVLFAPDLDILAEGCSEIVGSAKVNDAAISVSSQHGATRALISVGWSPRTSFADHLALLTDLIEQGAEYRRPGAATIGLLGVAAGWVDAYVEKRLNLWDAAAGIAIIRAAGGTVHAPNVFEYMDGPAPFLALNSDQHILAQMLLDHQSDEIPIP